MTSTLDQRIMALLDSTTSITAEDVRAATDTPIEVAVAALDAMTLEGRLMSIVGGGKARQRYRRAVAA